MKTDKRKNYFRSKRKCVECGQYKDVQSFPKFKYGRIQVCSNCYRTPTQEFRDWRANLDEPQKPIFDRLEKDGRVKMAYGARCVLVDVGNGLAKGHWIPDLPVELADVWNQEPLSPNWFSEKGRANLERIGRNIEKEKQKKELRAEERDLDREIAEDEEDEIDDGALIL